jgi:hypothetical protein
MTLCSAITLDKPNAAYNTNHPTVGTNFVYQTYIWGTNLAPTV